MFEFTYNSRFARVLAALITLGSRMALAQQESADYSQTEVARAEKRYVNEPTVQQIVAAALKATSADPKAAEELASRARVAGWVPTVRLAVRRGMGSGLSAYQTIETDRTSVSNDDNLVLEASLTFYFDKLLFSHYEVAAAKEKNALDKIRYELIRTVIALYFERRKLQLERDLSGRIDLKSAARIAEIEALLDVFTNGEFKRIISKKGR